MNPLQDATSLVSTIFHTLLLSTPRHVSPWAALVIWTARIVTLALLLRTYIVPSLIRLLSKRVRVRSISFRSIRGLYLHAGTTIWNVERVRLGWRWAAKEKTIRMRIVVEGLNVKVVRQTRRPRPPPRRRHARIPTLAEINPYPALWYTLLCATTISTFVRRLVQPVTTKLAVLALRTVILALPTLTQILEFQLDSATLHWPELAESRFAIHKASLSTRIAFSQVCASEAAIALPAVGPGVRLGPGVVQRLTSMWKFLMGGSRDRVWASTLCTAHISLQMDEIIGLVGDNASNGNTRLSSDIEGMPPNAFLALPSGIKLTGSAKFFPATMLPDPGSFNASLDLGEIHAVYDRIKPLLSARQAMKPVPPAFPEDILSDSDREGNTPMLTPGTPASPKSSALSPRIPSLEALSAFRWRQKTALSRRARRARGHPWILYLGRLDIKSSCLSLTSTSPVPLRVSIDDLSVHANLSNPHTNDHHREWVSGKGKPNDLFHTGVYAFGVSTSRTCLSRVGSCEARIVSLGALNISGITSNWPLHWPRASLLVGDPNAALLLAEASLAHVKFTDRLDLIQSLLEQMPKENKATSLPIRSTPSQQPSHIPRLKIDFHVGEIAASLVCPASRDSLTDVIWEVTLPGIQLSASSHFTHTVPKGYASHLHELPSAQVPLQMEFNILGSMESASVLVFANIPDGAEPGFRKVNQEPESFILVDSLELSVTGKILGSSSDDETSVVTIDPSTTMVDLFCGTEALSVELWHQDVILALAALLALGPQTSQPDRKQPAKRPLDQLPFGAFCKFGIRRLTVFVTSPDIAPDDEMDLSRGFGLRTSLSVTYAAMRESNAKTSPPPPIRAQMRQKLSLPEEKVMQAAAAARTSSVTNQEAIFVQVALHDLGVRAAVATPFTADDPYCQDLDDVTSHTHECVTVPEIVADLTLRGQRTYTGVPDICGMTVTVPLVRATLHLSDVYSLLLASQRLTALAKARPNLSLSRSQAKPSGRLSLSFGGTMESCQMLLYLPLNQKLYLRAQTTGFRKPSAGAITLYGDEVFGFVPHDSSMAWAELARLQAWSVSLPSTANGPLVVKVGGGARLRIPHAYVFNHLVRSLSVISKCMKHLVHTVKAGVYRPMGDPEIEGPKRVPNIQLHMHTFAFEAEDDPFESQLAIVWRAGSVAAAVRAERDEAFEVKAARVRAAEQPNGHSPTAPRVDYHFDDRHNVSITEARDRLLQVHALDWVARHRTAETDRRRLEEASQANLWAGMAKHAAHDIPDLVEIHPINLVPPLVRIFINDVNVAVSGPSFQEQGISDFLFERGGMPKDTQYSLLVPVHLKLKAGSLRLVLRDYPLPLVGIPPTSDGTPSLHFETDLVIAEEMGPPTSVDWVDCDILDTDAGVLGAASLHVSVPKTIMPVKTYASPDVHITTPGVTDLAWGVSYGPVMQDVMRVIETLTSPPQDPSPPVGFWDKLRLQVHWKVQVSFKGDVHLHIKGTRDPHVVVGNGAGFVLCWSGSPQLRIGCENDQKELAQLDSDSMQLAIPDLDVPFAKDFEDNASNTFYPSPRQFRKICAKLTSGVHFGIGALLERSCGDECQTCSGTPFHRACRFFDFEPHYKVQLQKKPTVPSQKSPDDSFNGFRSDFIHMSISLTASMGGGRATGKPSSFHLNPHVFAHFWAWWQLFDRTMSLQIRQGALWAKWDKLASPKLGQHLATLKYKIAVHRLFISHMYVDNSRDAWEDGVTPFVGVKALINDFHADMHQREEEALVAATPTRAARTIRRKPFSAAEVVMKGLDLRSVLAIFSEPLKQTVPLEYSAHSSNYRTRDNIPETDVDSPWVDMDDFVEVDSPDLPIQTIHILPAAACPQFTYFKRAKEPGLSKTRPRSEVTKFGNEDTHVCLLGKEASVLQVQINMAMSRIVELQAKASRRGRSNGFADKPGDGTSTSPEAKMIGLLKDYIAQLEQSNGEQQQGTANRHSYYMPADSVAPEEWAEFDNVYQVHCPKIFLDNIVRDVMMQYYYCSRARRGFEYHMATRAVKFIRDQAEVALATLKPDKHRMRDAVAGAQNAAANALRRMLTVESSGPRVSVLMSDDAARPSPAAVNPLTGWSEGVTLNKSHFCLLLKPQIVLRSEADAQSVCILAAGQAKSQAFNILDDANADDPVSGRVMTRSYTSVSGLQMFSPCQKIEVGDGCVPLEVLVDLRYETSDFDRVVPQTDATFQYDKFNRLRLRNNVNSVVQASSDSLDSHLQHQTDFIRIHVPNFTVTAKDKHFQAISDVVTDLLLYSDSAHKTRSDKLDTLLFSYDFTDLASAAHVVSDLQARLRQVVEAERAAESRLIASGDHGKTELLALKAQIMSFAEELTLIFDAIKLAQDKVDENHDHKSALLLRTSSSEISWRMLDDHGDLLAKLAVRDIDYSWLSRQDSSTVSKLQAGDLQAFAGSPKAVWPEIIAKHDEPSNHPLLKRGCFLLAKWTLLPPVGGITIYENFELLLHPMRLQIDTKVGSRLMEYVWPERRRRKGAEVSEPPPALRPRRITDNAATSRPQTPATPMTPVTPVRASLDSPRLFGNSLDTSDNLAPPTLRRIATSRSFTDLRSASKEQALASPRMQRNISFGPLTPLDQSETSLTKRDDKAKNDAEEMKSRSSQKTFVFVRVGSLHLLLSVMKEQSFACQDARIQTRDLEFRNQTWSFEELVDQFIPSDPSWKGWVKMALHQPLIPVLPVARELFAKTKFARKAGHLLDLHSSRNKTHEEQHGSPNSFSSGGTETPTLDDDQSPFAFPASKSEASGLNSIPGSSSDLSNVRSPGGRHRMFKMFTRHVNKKSVDSQASASSSLDHISKESTPRISINSLSSKSPQP